MSVEDDNEADDDTRFRLHSQNPSVQYTDIVINQMMCSYIQIPRCCGDSSEIGWSYWYKHSIDEDVS